MITTIRKKGDLPNKEGFKFIAFLPDGTAFENIVTKNKNGCHTCEKFSEIVGWLPCNLAQPVLNPYKYT